MTEKEMTRLAPKVLVCPINYRMVPFKEMRTAKKEQS